MAISLFKPFIKRKDMDAVLTCLALDHIGPGEEGEALVTQVLELLGYDAGIALREYQRAIEVVFKASGLQSGDAVGLPALAPSEWERTALSLGLIPVLLDVAERSPSLDISACQKSYADQPFKALLVHHSIGYASQVEPIANWCHKHSIALLEDISQALVLPADKVASSNVAIEDIEGFALQAPNANQEEKSVQSLPGRSAAFVLLQTESWSALTTGGGCLVFSQNKKTSHALSASVEDLPDSAWMGDMNAALGRSQFRELPHFLKRRSDMFDAFTRSLLRGRHHGFDPDCHVLAHSFPVLIQGSTADVQAYAKKKGVETVLAFEGSILFKKIADPNFEANRFVHAYGFVLRTLLFPLHPGLGPKEIELIQKVLASLP